MTGRLPLAVTMGEPAGIGGELTLKAWLARRTGGRPFVAIDDPVQLDSLARRLDLEVPLREVSGIAQAEANFANYLPILPVKLTAPVHYGHPDPHNARATIESIEWAARLAQSGAFGTRAVG